MSAGSKTTDVSATTGGRAAPRRPSDRTRPAVAARRGPSAGLIGLCAGLLLVAPPAGPGPVAAQDPVSRSAIADLGPEGVERGRRLYLDRASCHACHGREGRGVPGMGSSLTDGEWIVADGSPGSLLDVVRSGVPAARSPSGVPMPPRGGARLGDEEMRAVVAYLLSLREEGR